MEKQMRIPLSIKFIIGFHILSIIFWIVGQGGAVVAYDTVAKLGLQEAREAIDPVIAVINRGIAFADILIGVPLFILAVIGLCLKRFWGIVFSWMAFGVNFYWPAVAWSKQYFYLEASVKCQPFSIGVHFMLAFVFLFSAWGSWYQYKNRKLFD